MADATLVAGSRGAQYVTRDQLAQYIPPPATDTWKPIAHSELVDTLHEVMSYRGMFITKDQYVIDRGGARMFGTFDLEWQKMEEYGAALGFRHATDKSMAIQIAVGARVFVCSNMSFGGDGMITVRKHSGKLDLAAELDHAMYSFQHGWRRLVDDIHVQQCSAVTHGWGKELLYDIFRLKILPTKVFHNVATDWDSASDRNAWALHNACTAHVKTLAPGPAFMATARLAKFFTARF